MMAYQLIQDEIQFGMIDCREATFEEPAEWTDGLMNSRGVLHRNRYTETHGYGGLHRICDYRAALSSRKFIMIN